MQTSYQKVALRTSLIFWVISAGWIILSDRALEWFISDPAIVNEFQTYKGWFYVTAASVGLFILLIEQLRRVDRSESELKVTSEQLFHSQERIRLAAEAAKIGSWERDLATDELLWDQKDEQIMGFIPGSFPKNYTEFINLIRPEDLPLLREAEQRGAETGVFQAELRFNLPPNLERWGYIEGKVHRDQHNNPVKTIGIVWDITDRKQKEIELARSQAQLEAVFNSIQEGIVVTDMEGKFLLVNEAEVKITGFASKTEMLQALEFFTQRYELYTLDGKQLSVDEWPLSRILKGERLNQLEIFVRRTDIGLEQYFSFSGETVCNESGEPVLAVIVTRDITAQKKQEKLIAERERLISAINNTAPNMIFLWEVHSGQVLYVNDSITKILGYTPQEVVRNEHLTIRELCHPSDLADIRDFHRTLNEAPNGTVQTHDVRIRHKNGDWRVIQGRDVVFERDAQGRAVQVLSVADDVTVRYAAEQALRTSEHRFRQLTESLPQLVWTCLPDGECDYVSPQWVEYTGVPAQKQLGLQWINQIHPDDREFTLDIWQHAIKTHVPFDIEFRMRRFDGTYHWFQSRTVPLRDETGEIVKWFGSNLDMQVQRELRESLRAQKDRLQALADLSRSFAEVGNDYETVIQRIVKVISEFTKDYCAVWLFSEDGKWIHYVGAYHPSPQVQKYLDSSVNTAPYLVAESLLDQEIYEHRKPVFYPQVSATEMQALLSPRRQEIVELLGLHSWIVTPLQAEGRMLGYVCTGRSLPDSLPFDESDLQLFQEISDRAAMAILNAELYKQSRSLTLRLQTIREDERKRIAREIHDELGQALVGLKFDLSWLEAQILREHNDKYESYLDKIQAMSRTLGASIQLGRKIAADLRPSVLDTFGLLEAIQWQAREFEERTRIKCLVTANCETIKLDMERSTAIFRIFQESLTNIARHANAQQVKIALFLYADRFQLEVSDDGRGITANELQGTKSLGLLGMRERVSLFNGEVKITGSPNQGTTVTVTLPLGAQVEYSM